MRRAKSKSGFYREKWVCRPRRQIIDRDGFGFDGFVKPLFLGKPERAQLQQDRPQLEDSTMPDAPAPPPTLPALLSMFTGKARSEAMDEKANLVTLKTLAETTLAETLSPSHVKRPRDGGTRDAGADLTATLPWEEKVTPTTTAPPQCFQNLPRRTRDTCSRTIA